MNGNTVFEFFKDNIKALFYQGTVYIYCRKFTATRVSVSQIRRHFYR